MRRRVIRAPVYIRIGWADHIQRLILNVIDEPRRRRRAAVGDPVPVVPRLVSPCIVDQRMVLGGEIVDLRLFRVVVVVARTFDHVGRVVGRARDAPLCHRETADHLLDARRRGLHQGFFQFLRVAGSVRVRSVSGVRRRVRGRSRCGGSERLHQRLLANN